MRDVRGTINVFKLAKIDDKFATPEGIAKTVLEAFGEDVETNALYAKIIEADGDEKSLAYRMAYQNLIRNGKTPDEAAESISSGLAKALYDSDNNGALLDAAIAYVVDGNTKTYEDAYNSLIRDGYTNNVAVATMDKMKNRVDNLAEGYNEGDEDIIAQLDSLSEDQRDAIIGYAETLDKEEEKDDEKYLFAKKDLYNSLVSGNLSTVSATVKRKMLKDGKSNAEADKAINDTLAKGVDDHYLQGDITETKAYTYYTSNCGMTPATAKLRLDNLNNQKAYTGTGTFSYSRYKSLYNSLHNNNFEDIYETVYNAKVEEVVKENPDMSLADAKAKAEKDVLSRLQTEVGNAYKNGEIGYDTAYYYITEYCNRSAVQATRNIANWDKQKK